jgi:hypothetical protein
MVSDWNSGLLAAAAGVVLGMALRGLRRQWLRLAYGGGKAGQR